MQNEEERSEYMERSTVGTKKPSPNGLTLARANAAPAALVPIPSRNATRLSQRVALTSYGPEVIVGDVRRSRHSCL